MFLILGKTFFFNFWIHEICVSRDGLGIYASSTLENIQRILTWLLYVWIAIQNFSVEVVMLVSILVCITIYSKPVFYTAILVSVWLASVSLFIGFNCLVDLVTCIGLFFCLLPLSHLHLSFLAVSILGSNTFFAVVRF